MYATKIGSLQLPHCVYNASGVWDTTVPQCLELDSTKYCGAVVTKSCTINKRDGNEYPKYHFGNPYFSINSNGLENKGLNYYLNNVVPVLRGPIFISVGGMSDSERIEMISIINWKNLEKKVGIELNLSCPNLDCPGPAYNAETLDNALQDILSKVSNTLTFGLKLPPYYLPTEFEAVASVLEKYQDQIDFITCINSVPNGIDYDIDNNTPKIAPNGGYGGIGGSTVLPIGLANVSRFAHLFRERKIDIAIIGCGGVSTGEDMYKYLLAGASAVQIGTHLWKNGTEVFEQVSKEFQKIMNRKGYLSLNEISH